MKHLRLLFVITILFLFVEIATAQKTLYESVKKTATLWGKFDVVRVVDGDTIYIKDKDGERVRVRFIAVNAPELGRDGKAAEPFCDNATEFVKNAIKASGGKVTLYQEGRKTDNYDRKLAWVVVKTKTGERELGELLVSEGLAKIYSQYVPTADELKILQKLESTAREQKRNIWSNTERSAVRKIRQ